MSNEQVVLEVQHLTKQFYGLVAVNDLSFQVKKRRIHALIGPNGAGKTTTVNMITGENPQTGNWTYFSEYQAFFFDDSHGKFDDWCSGQDESQYSQLADEFQKSEQRRKNAA